jgi:hypothetical protein
VEYEIIHYILLIALRNAPHQNYKILIKRGLKNMLNISILKEFQPNNKELSLETKLRLKQHEQEMELLMALFDVDSLEDETTIEEDIMAEIAEIEEERTIQEQIEDELCSIEDYRGFVLDISIKEVEWINENISLNCLAESEYDTVTAISKEFKTSITKAKQLVRKCLGYKRGSDYQNKQRDYVDELVTDFECNLYSDLERQLRKARLYDFYNALLNYVKNHVSLKPQGVDEDELVFFVLYPELIQACKRAGMTKGISNRSLRSKLYKLCDLGLLVNLEDDKINNQTLAIARTVAKKSSETVSIAKGVDVEIKRRNFFLLKDLSPQVQEEAIAKIKLDNELGLRNKDKSATSLALVYGEEVQQSVFAQGEPNISETKLRNFNRAAKQLLEKYGYYNEEMLRKAYLKFDKHTLAKDSYALTRTYLSRVAKDNSLIKTRVNSDVREDYELPSKIKSNSFIFVKRENN